ncbi:MAG: pyridoxal phosphate-dependent aminotransferase [Candidatus Anstonellaceae archaeon]
MFYQLVEKIIKMEQSGKKVLKLHIGDTRIPTPRVAVDAVKKAITSTNLGYSSSAGLQRLRELAAEREGCKAQNIVVGPGSKHLIYGILTVFRKKYRNISVPSPFWSMYKLASNSLGLKFFGIKTKLNTNWKFNSIPKSDIILICNPNNPTSTVYSNDSIKEVIENSHYPVIIDEAYKGLAFERIDSFDCIRIRSFSKEFNMENWRLGYAVVPDEIAKKLIQYNQITCTCVPNFVQAAGIACLENEKELLKENKKVWKKRLDAAASALKRAGFKFAMPQSAMYIFATHSAISSGTHFSMELLKHGVAVAPGEDFGEKRFFRMTCNATPEELKEAVEKMEKIL